MTTAIIQKWPRVKIPTPYISGAEVWWDEKISLVGRSIDTTTGRIGYNYTENAVFFADNARYAATEQISITTQLNHDWLIGSSIHPHIHWPQSSANIPHMLLGYRFWDNGDAVPSTWTLAIPSAHIFTYSSGTLAQLTTFGEIDLSSLSGLSPMIQFKIWRDADVASTKYAGADPLSGNWLLHEFDYHYQRDTLGSRKEFEK